MVVAVYVGHIPSSFLPRVQFEKKKKNPIAKWELRRWWPRQKERRIRNGKAYPTLKLQSHARINMQRDSPLGARRLAAGQLQQLAGTTGHMAAMGKLLLKRNIL